MVELFLFCFSLENLKREQRNLSQLNTGDSFFRGGFQSALEGDYWAEFLWEDSDQDLSLSSLGLRCIKRVFLMHSDDIYHGLKSSSGFPKRKAALLRRLSGRKGTNVSPSMSRSRLA